MKGARGGFRRRKGKPECLKVAFVLKKESFVDESDPAFFGREMWQGS